MALATQPFAVLLNPNARRVSQSVFQRVSEIVDPDHVYVSQDEATAPSLIRDIVRQGYRTVFTGGGDGTVTQFINQLPEDDGAPRVGILKLGTGNAMAEIVSSGDPMVDLKSYADNPSADDYSLPLCESEGVRFAFAGIGVDGWVLNDYKALQERYRGAVAKRLLHNVSGYFAATFGVSVPRMIARWARRQRAVARITNIGPPAYGIEQDAVGGRVGRTFRPGEVLYEGPANAVMFGTCPYYGYSLRALPFAGLETGAFHLRVSDVPIPYIIGNLRRFWRGTIRHPRLVDFSASRVHIEFSEPMPYQLAGEAMGYRQELTVGMARRAIDLVRFI